MTTGPGTSTPGVVEARRDDPLDEDHFGEAQPDAVPLDEVRGDALRGDVAPRDAPVGRPQRGGVRGPLESSSLGALES